MINHIYSQLHWKSIITFWYWTFSETLVSRFSVSQDQLKLTTFKTRMMISPVFIHTHLSCLMLIMLPPPKRKTSFGLKPESFRPHMKALHVHGKSVNKSCQFHFQNILWEKLSVINFLVQAIIIFYLNYCKNMVKFLRLH